MRREAERMNRMVGTLAAGGLVLAGVVASAADAVPVVTNRLETTVAVGATFNDGNTESSQFNASIGTEGENCIGSFKAGLEGNYAENTTDAGKSETSKKDAKLAGNVKKTYSPHTYSYLDSTLLYDDMADIDYRLTVGPGVGVYAIKTDMTKLSGEIGPSYVWEKVGGEKDDYPSLRVAQGFEHKFGDQGKIWQTAEWMPEFSDFSAYLVNAEFGAEAAMNHHLNLRVVLQDRYDSMPAEGREHNDLTTIIGVSSKF
jgi:putative salt-induced outer membrane protein YdiY